MKRNLEKVIEDVGEMSDMIVLLITLSETFFLSHRGGCAAHDSIPGAVAILKSLSRSTLHISEQLENLALMTDYPRCTYQNPSKPTPP